MARALRVCAEHGGDVASDGARAAAAAAGAWRDAFLRAPYLRDVLVALGVLAETFETAITWERFAGVPRRGHRRRARGAAASRGRGHAAASPTSIPTAPAPYFTVIAPARRGDEVAQWDEIKARRVRRRSSPAAGRSPTTTRSAATTGPGTTASGRSRSPPRCAAAKAAVDPAGMLNPGVLIDP